MSEALLIFFLLAIKHGVCDLALQALYCRPSNKHRYFSGRAHLHALHHGLGTLLVTVFFASMPLALLLALMDYLLHWHIDFVKSTLVKWQDEYNVVSLFLTNRQRPTRRNQR